jgi:hypothetical protein
MAPAHHFHSSSHSSFNVGFNASVGRRRALQLAALAGSPEFLPWVRANPALKPRLSGRLSTAQGVRHVTTILDTGATHCFICSRLAAALDLPRSLRLMASVAAGCNLASAKRH